MQHTENSNSKSVFNKLIHYCNYRERSTKEIEIKLLNLCYTEKEIISAIQKGKDLGIVDNNRFAKSFARGKNRKNRWGKNRIRFELKVKGLTNQEIEFGISNINEEDYKSSLIKCITIYKKKSKKFQEFKLVNYLLNKGYEKTIITDNIKNY